MAIVKLIKRPPPPKQQAKVIRETAVVAIKAILIEEMIRRHKEYVAPWNNPSNKPDFRAVDKSKKGLILLHVEMSAEAAENEGKSVWQLINYGTSVRFMQLSDDWESKTLPGQPFSGPGRGRRLGTDPDKPQRGIAARRIDIMMAEEPGIDHGKAVLDAFHYGFRRNFT